MLRLELAPGSARALIWLVLRPRLHHCYASMPLASTAGNCLNYLGLEHLRGCSLASPAGTRASRARHSIAYLDALPSAIAGDSRRRELPWELTRRPWQVRCQYYLGRGAVPGSGSRPTFTKAPRGPCYLLIIGAFRRFFSEVVLLPAQLSFCTVAGPPLPLPRPLPTLKHNPEDCKLPLRMGGNWGETGTSINHGGLWLARRAANSAGTTRPSPFCLPP